MNQSQRARRLQIRQQQVNRLNCYLEKLHHLSQRYTQVRLTIFLIGLLLSLITFYNGWLGWGSLTIGLFIIIFGLVVYQHRQVEQGILRHQIWQQLKENQIARMTHAWEKLPAPTTGRAAASHPFARDLDLIGPRSVHQLLDVAISQEGSQRLKKWLLHQTPDLSTIESRQTLVRTLRPLHLFRDKLSLHGLLASTGSGGWWQGDRLQTWLAERADPNVLRLPLILATILAGVNILLFGLNLLGLTPALWMFSLTIYVTVSLWRWGEMAALFDNALTLQNGLKKLEGVFHYLETAPLKKWPPLEMLCQPFRDPYNRPSTRLKKISNLVAGAGLAQNPFIGLALNLLLPWNLFFAHRLNHFKENIANQLPQWLDIWFELEALSSLAEFAHLNPGHVFPQISNPTMDATQPLFTAQTLGHPLIPQSQKVCNDFTFERVGELGIITGSNMAGKSSFLRTVGVNVCLAYAGGVVDATACQLTLFRLYTCINVTDSVNDGISYFYAEVKRLKALLQALETPNPLPLGYLIDEIFRGTNNRERYLGSKAYIRALTAKNGFGLVATHDLELVHLADERPQISNYHFRENVLEGRMVFDYQLRTGPCPTTNALKIMAIEGLPVSDSDLKGA